MSLTRFRAEDGTLAGATPLLVMNDDGRGSSVQLMATEDGFVVTTAGTSTAGTAAGHTAEGTAVTVSTTGTTGMLAQAGSSSTGETEQGAASAANSPGFNISAGVPGDLATTGPGIKAALVAGTVLMLLGVALLLGRRRL